MYRVTPILVTVFGCHMGTSLDSTRSEYRAGYEHVKADSNLLDYCINLWKIDESECNIVVDDTVRYIPYGLFSGQIINRSGGSSSVVIDSLYRIDEERRDRLPRYEEDVYAIAKEETGKVGLYLSEPYNNTILAELVGNYNPSLSYRENTRHN